MPLVQSACEKTSAAVCCLTEWSYPDLSNFVPAGGDSSDGNARFASHFPFFLKTVLALAESAPHPDVSPSCHRALLREADRSPSDPSAGASRESLSVWSSPDDSDSVHGSDDKYDGVSGCGGTGD